MKVSYLQSVLVREHFSFLKFTCFLTKAFLSPSPSPIKMVKWESLSRVQLFATPWTIQSMEFPGQNTGVGSLSLLQGIFSKGSNPGLPHCGKILYQLSQKGSPRILQRVAYPFSSGSSQPRNRTRISCTAGRFFSNWGMRQYPCFLDVHLMGWFHRKCQMGIS